MAGLWHIDNVLDDRCGLCWWYGVQHNVQRLLYLRHHSIVLLLVLICQADVFYGHLPYLDVVILSSCCSFLVRYAVRLVA